MTTTFRRLELLGKGSYGQVFKAEWNGRLVAVKELHSNLWEAGGGYVAQFKAECEILEKLDHKNVVQLLKFEVSNSSPPRIITELLHCDLEKYITSLSPTKIPFPAAVSIMSDVADGLAYIHGHDPPIVHRDLACKNILLTNEKQAKIADLGLAKVFPRNEKMYASPVPGTPVYNAPETVPLGNAKVKYDVKIDIFSYGVILMEVINGSPPVVDPQVHFTEDKKRIPEQKRRESDIKKMDEHKLKEIVLRCIDDSSFRRPSAEEVSEWLQYEWSKIQQKRKIANYDPATQLPTLKIIVLGQAGAGKSCLISRFVHHKFNERMVPTIGSMFPTTKIKLHDKEYNLLIEDTAGQEVFHSIPPTHIKLCHGVVLVADLTDRHSLDEGIPEMEQLVKKYAPDCASMILVGNKTDLADAQQSKRKIRRENAELFACTRGIPYIETSAFSGLNVNKAFELLANTIYDTLDLSDIDFYIASTDNTIALHDATCQQPDANFLQRILVNCFERLQEGLGRLLMWWRGQ